MKLYAYSVSLILSLTLTALSWLKLTIKLFQGPPILVIWYFQHVLAILLILLIANK